MEIQRPSRLRRRTTVLLTAIATLAIAVPVTVFASHQFTDVPDSNPYHSQIDKIVDAGITTGCGGGNYCPTQSVTREQMAAFMGRGFGVAGGGVTEANVEVPHNAPTRTSIASTTIRTPGAPGGTGYLHVTASVNFIDAWNAATPQCPCFVLFGLNVNGSGIGSPAISSIGAEPVPFLVPIYATSLGSSWTIEVPTDTNITLDIGAFVLSTSEAPLDAFGTVDAVYTPFSSGGSIPIVPAGPSGAGSLEDLMEQLLTR